VAGLLLVAATLTLSPRLHGDAGEYVLMLESFYRHGSPELQPGDRAALRGMLQETGQSLDEGRVLPNYHRGKGGKLYGYHFWGYSLAGIPARVLVGVLGLDPLRALPLTNALLFSLSLLAVAGLPWDPFRRPLLGGLLLFSPALGFLLWPHPEVFSFAFVTLALALAAAERWTPSVLSAALASVQNPPLVLFVGLLWVLAVVDGTEGTEPGGVRQRIAGWPRAALGPTLAALPAFLPGLFFQWQFGVFNISVRPAEAAQSLSVLRALDLVVDPNLGLLPHVPLTFLLAVLGALLALFARRPVPAVQVFILLPLLMYACTANSNWNNGTSGPSRYVVWMLPILAFVAAGETGGPPSRRPGRWTRVALVLALATQGAAVLVRGGPLAPVDFLEHSPAARFVLDRWPALYNPKPEVFVERTRGYEGPVEGPVVYRDTKGRCRKAWLQWRYAQALVAECGPPPGEMAARLEANSRRPEAKRLRTYVDY
jgi:hypothetical protein